MCDYNLSSIIENFDSFIFVWKLFDLSPSPLFSLCSCDEKDKEMILERQSLSERQKGLQEEQERLLQSQSLLNQREEHFLSRSQELNRLQKELEDTKAKVEKEHEALHDEKTTLKLKEATLMQREEVEISQLMIFVLRIYLSCSFVDLCFVKTGTC